MEDAGKFTQRHRIKFTLAGAILLAAVLAWAFGSSPLDLSMVEFWPWLPCLLAAGICSLFVSARSLQVSGRMVAVEIDGRASLVYVASANLMELLPLPGGAMVRTAAIHRSGGSLGNSGLAVMLGAGLTIAVSLLVLALALVCYNVGAGWIVLAGAFAACLFVLWQMHRLAGWGVASYALILRLVLLALSAVRLYCALQILGDGNSFADALLLTIAITAGTAVSIIPAGLGVSEVLAAGIAMFTTTAPTMAILAVSSNRLVNILLSGLVCLIAGSVRRARVQVQT